MACQKGEANLQLLVGLEFDPQCVSEIEDKYTLLTS